MVGFTLNGLAIEAEGGRSLLSYLRDEAGLTGAKRACGEGACGACSVLVNGALLTSCTIPLERIAGRSVVTVEGIPPSEIEAYVRAFSEAGAVQCGFCTPGMVLAAKALLDRNPDPSPAEVRAALRRNLCRCTGYAKIVAGVLGAARERRKLV
jgi:aerobic-type carbon monoxide dehydrogenase small subunit (CoxS/CutS family)